MNFSANRRVPISASSAVALPRPVALTSGDRMLQSLVCLAMLLEIVVFVEPAPVDAVIVLCLVAGLLSGKLNFSALGPSVLVSISLFALLNLVSMYDPFDPARALSYVAVTLYLIASWFLFTGLLGRYGSPLMRKLISVYAIAGLISSLLGIVGYFHLVPFSDQLLLAGRARGLFKDCNVYGPFFVPMGLFSLSRLMDSRNPARERFWQGLIFAAAAVGMLLSFSRACWLNFGVALAALLCGQAFLLPRQSKASGLASKAGILLGATVAVVLLLNVPAVHSMLELRVNGDRLQGYDRVRFATQSLALDAARQHVFGIGPGQSEDVFSYATHSLYLRILAENGAGALLALLFFMGATLSRCLTLMRRAADPWLREISLIVFATICGHIVNSFVIDTVHWRSIWFIYALPWVCAPLQHYVRTFPAMQRFGAQYARARVPGLAQV